MEEKLRAALEEEGCHLAAVAAATLSGAGAGAAAGNGEGRAPAEQRLDLQF